MAKNLVYFTVGGSPAYAELLRVAVATVLAQVGDGDIEILVMCDEDFAPHITDIPGHRFVTGPNPDGVAASMRKVEIFDWPLLRAYERVLFLDCDVVVTAPIGALFDAFTNGDMLYVCPEKTSADHASPYFSLSYDDAQLAGYVRDGVRPFNCGQFAFRVTDEMEAHFGAVRELMRKWTGEYFYEQSFMNHHFGLARATSTWPLEEWTRLGARDVGDGLSMRPLMHFTLATIHARLKLAMMRHVAGLAAAGEDAPGMLSLGESLADLPGVRVMATSPADDAVTLAVCELFAAAGIAAEPGVGQSGAPTLVVESGPPDGGRPAPPADAWFISLDVGTTETDRWVARQHLEAIASLVCAGVLARRGLDESERAAALACRRFSSRVPLSARMRSGDVLPRVGPGTTLARAAAVVLSYVGHAAVLVEDDGRYLATVTPALLAPYVGLAGDARVTLGLVPNLKAPPLRPSMTVDEALRAAPAWAQGMLYPVVSEEDDRVIGIVDLRDWMQG
jgi:hypothetical protein